VIFLAHVFTLLEVALYEVARYVKSQDLVYRRLLILFFQLSPVGLGLVTIMLYFFRKVYAEIVTALPSNGGCYNALLNTSSKTFASLASCLSILSYTATSLVSAYDAVLYLAVLWPGVGMKNTFFYIIKSHYYNFSFIDFRAATIIILAIFALLTIMGVKESSVASMCMFALHVAMLSTFVIWCVIHGFQDNFETYRENSNSPLPDIIATDGSILASHSVAAAIFYGFSSSLLGISGFESAANYVEEMADNKVYVQTLDWMW
jgi:amino acid transporter